jgi:hypothetical protein
MPKQHEENMTATSDNYLQLYRRRLLAITLTVPISYHCRKARADSEYSGDATAYLQRMIDNADKEVVLPAGTFQISKPLNLSRQIALVGRGASTQIIQTGFPEPAIIVAASNCRIEGLCLQRHFRRPLANWGRYMGLHGSARDSAVFVLGAGECKLSGLKVQGFGRGITLAGGHRRRVSGVLRDGHSLFIADENLRNLCLTCDNRVLAKLRTKRAASRWMRARLSNSGELQVDNVQEACGIVEIDLIVGRGLNNLVEDCLIEGAEFGVSFQMQDGLRIERVTFQDTIQMNFPHGRILAPAHAIYGADGEDEEGLRSGTITISSVTARRDSIGTTAFKVRGAEEVRVSSARCEDFGGIFSFDEIDQLELFDFQAVRCRSVLERRGLRGAALRDVKRAKLSNGRIELAKLSAASTSNCLFCVEKSAGSDEYPPFVSIDGLRISTSSRMPSPCRLDALRIGGRAWSLSGARAELSGLELHAEHGTPGMVGLKLADVSDVALNDSSIVGFPTSIELTRTVGRFVATGSRYSVETMVDRRAGSRP